ncbi:TenA/THI-4 family protein [Bradyrhizobium japonicum]|uniref:TenA/THI-4 family protein n=1 Tax=Bradyrhizobium japonicum TaxID=375 RepID=UPI002A142A72|nr:hypothetical protein [Bradyrhizobium japonicum]MCP1793658.1 hypothetical protein [Bradyrhizobium japonicum]MCP1806091.1 hypothetical protein [Bradyrhizobium japonicum]MCP1815019.1 hypothetical protein [Bradyrhizobium japonicum]MCP1873463.1 hypothetical protein [Bradyrhizobium japonicum]
MQATDQDRALIKRIQLEAAGRLHTEGAVDRRPFQRLEELGWLVGASLNLNEVLYTITELGAKEALRD